MKYLVPAVMYPSFFGLIGFAIYITGSSWPLLALIAVPSWSSKEDTDNNKETK